MHCSIKRKNVGILFILLLLLTLMGSVQAAATLFSIQIKVIAQGSSGSGAMVILGTASNPAQFGSQHTNSTGKVIFNISHQPRTRYTIKVVKPGYADLVLNNVTPTPTGGTHRYRGKQYLIYSKLVNLKPNRQVKKECDLAVKFVAPRASQLPGNRPVEYKIKVENVGSGYCHEKQRLALKRYNGRSVGGYGSTVGGSGGYQRVPQLNIGQRIELTYTENLSNSRKLKGDYTYTAEFAGAFNDIDNSNHRRISKTVKYK